MIPIHSIHPQGILSFPLDSEKIELNSLNVLIGPNGSGKSNLIEIFRLLNSLPNSINAEMISGGGVQEWQWKGESHLPGIASIGVTYDGESSGSQLRYMLGFRSSGNELQILSEAIVNEKVESDYSYANLGGEIWIKEYAVDDEKRGSKLRELDRQSIRSNESILSQRKDPERYRELTWTADLFQSTCVYQEWSFGRFTPTRFPQRVDLATYQLFPDGSNLALILNKLDHNGQLPELNKRMAQFLPRFERLTTRVVNGAIHVFVHERGLQGPIPASRLSDGTLRFLSIMAILLDRYAPPIVCIDEPDIGLHPDAVGILAEVLVEAKERMQLIVTTHSDALVSALSDHSESVLVCEHRGGTVMKRVESGLVQHWLEKYRLGEIWRIGALGGNP